MVTIANRADRVDTGSLDELHFFRQKQFKHMFFCPSCIRSFESDKEETQCKFCDGHVRRVGDTHQPVTEPAREEKHRFYCPKCGKIFERSTRLLACEVCNTPVTHFYEYRELDLRSKLLYRFYRLVGRRPADTPVSAGKTDAQDAAPAPEKRFTVPKITVPALALPRLRISFGRGSEERPTR